MSATSKATRRERRRSAQIARVDRLAYARGYEHGRNRARSELMKVLDVGVGETVVGARPTTPLYVVLDLPPVPHALHLLAKVAPETPVRHVEFHAVKMAYQLSGGGRAVWWTWEVPA